MGRHLGMACGPIGGLVLIPCIERNASGADQAVAAASLTLRGDDIHDMTLHAVIETMRRTGLDMQTSTRRSRSEASRSTSAPAEVRWVPRLRLRTGRSAAAVRLAPSSTQPAAG